jgi:hypothetical protein
MPRVPGGVHCSRCDRDVLDLRRVPQKRALAILAEKRELEGRVCAWVRATPDGTPIFSPDPSRFARFTAPAIVATALTACTPTAAHHESTPIAFVPATPMPSSGGNTNASPTPVMATVDTAPPVSPVRPASNAPQLEIEMAGDMAF